MKPRLTWLASRSLGPSLTRFVLVFALLVAPWPGLGRVFADTVGAIATAVADPISAASNVTLTLRSPLASEAQTDWRGVIVVRQDLPEGPVQRAGAIDLRRAGYLQLATFIALAVAWPPRGRRRALLAAIVVLAVVSATLALPVLDFLSQIGAVSPGRWLGPLVSLGSRTVVGAPGMAYAIPGLAWVAAVSGTGTAMLALTSRRRSGTPRSGRCSA